MGAVENFRRRPTTTADWVFAVSGLFIASLVCAAGTVMALKRGGTDFAVFHEAWKLVLSGHTEMLYRDTPPDAYLYAPGFAWLLAPMGAVPRAAGLVLWCLAKCACLGLVVRSLGRRLDPWGPIGWGSVAWGVALVARPLLIDLQYGQVNLFILAAAVWALSRHAGGRAAARADFFAWFALAIAAASKLYALPLLAAPFLSARPASAAKRRLEIAGSFCGLALIAALPMLDGWPHTLALLQNWKGALLAKGLPLETHNQSFVAFLHHVFSGEKVHVIALFAWRDYGIPGVQWATETFSWLGYAWFLGWIGISVAWLAARRARAEAWLAIACGLVVLPSHLVWKPYFLFGLPAAALVFHRVWTRARGRFVWAGLLIAAVGINFTSIDVLGYENAARAEAYALMLWSYLLLLAVAVAAGRETELSSA